VACSRIVRAASQEAGSGSSVSVMTARGRGMGVVERRHEWAGRKGL
jgi:hypothetical protein